MPRAGTPAAQYRRFASRAGGGGTYLNDMTGVDLGLREIGSLMASRPSSDSSEVSTEFVLRSGRYTLQALSPHWCPKMMSDGK